MIPYLTIALAVCSLFATAYMHLVRPARKARQLAVAVALEPEPAQEPVPEPKIPRDTSRPYPRPKGFRSNLNRVCPVCGTGKETGDLDGKVLGWPAHASCAEWLGDWGTVCDGCGVPLGTGVRYHDQAGHRYCPACDRKGYGHPAPTQTSGGNTVVFTAKGAVTAKGGAGGSSTAISITNSPGAQISVTDGSFPIASVGDVGRALEMVKNGLASANEVRERLNREIIASWGVPPMALEEHTHKVGDPVPIERCPKCGAQFAGTPDYLREAFRLHRQMGCPPPF